MVCFFELCVRTCLALGLPRTRVSIPGLMCCHPCFLDLQVDQVQRHAPDRALPPGPLLRLRARGQYVPPLLGAGGAHLGRGDWEGRGSLGCLEPKPGPASGCPRVLSVVTVAR